MKFRRVFLDLALLFITGFLWLVGFLYLVQLFSSKQLEHPMVISLLGIAVFGTVIFGTQIMYFLHQILHLIVNYQSFSQASVTLIRKVRRNIGFVSISFLFSMPFFVTIANSDDAPGVILLGFAIICVPFAIYIFSQIIEELFESALNLQTDHDLTV